MTVHLLLSIQNVPEHRLQLWKIRCLKMMVKIVLTDY